MHYQINHWWSYFKISSSMFSNPATSNETMLKNVLLHFYQENRCTFYSLVSRNMDRTVLYTCVMGTFSGATVVNNVSGLHETVQSGLCTNLLSKICLLRWSLRDYQHLRDYVISAVVGINILPSTLYSRSAAKWESLGAFITWATLSGCREGEAQRLSGVVNSIKRILKPSWLDDELTEDRQNLLWGPTPPYVHLTSTWCHSRPLAFFLALLSRGFPNLGLPAFLGIPIIAASVKLGWLAEKLYFSVRVLVSPLCLATART